LSEENQALPLENYDWGEKVCYRTPMGEWQKGYVVNVDGRSSVTVALIPSLPCGLEIRDPSNLAKIEEMVA